MSGWRSSRDASTQPTTRPTCLESERYDDAVWAAEQGLLADPLAEILVHGLMEAATTGSIARVHAAMSRLRRQVAENGDANDADDWLNPRDRGALRTTIALTKANLSAIV